MKPHGKLANIKENTAPKINSKSSQKSKQLPNKNPPAVTEDKPKIFNNIGLSNDQFRYTNEQFIPNMECYPPLSFRADYNFPSLMDTYQARNRHSDGVTPSFFNGNQFNDDERNTFLPPDALNPNYIPMSLTDFVGNENLFALPSTQMSLVIPTSDISFDNAQQDEFKNVYRPNTIFNSMVYDHHFSKEKVSMVARNIEQELESARSEITDLTQTEQRIHLKRTPKSQFIYIFDFDIIEKVFIQEIDSDPLDKSYRESRHQYFRTIPEFDILNEIKNLITGLSSIPTYEQIIVTKTSKNIISWFLNGFSFNKSEINEKLSIVLVKNEETTKNYLLKTLRKDGYKNQVVVYDQNKFSNVPVEVKTFNYWPVLEKKDIENLRKCFINDIL